MEQVETVIVGGGQAGLAMSCHLGRLGLEHLIIERARVAERWRTQRWDSLMFQFPNWTIELPGSAYEGNEPEGFSHKDAVIEFIEDYGASIKAPVRTDTNVSSLDPSSRTGRFRLATDRGIVEAQNVVIATGPYQRPRIPLLASGLSPTIHQLHASEYRNPDTLPEGSVLVVGSGASGCQIAEELLDRGRRVYLAIGRHRRIPRRYRGRDAFWWRRTLGHLDLIADPATRATRMPAPLVTGVRGGHDIDLRAYAAKGMTLAGHVRDIRDGRIAIASDLGESLRAGDQAHADFTRAADDYVRQSDMRSDFPHSEAMRTPSATVPEINEIDIRSARIATVIWATGYTLDFRWVKLPVFDERGEPVHHRGATSIPGIHFLGLPWLHKSKSSFLSGVGEDAEHLAQSIAEAR